MRYKLIIMLLMVAMGMQAQKSRTSRKKSTKVTKVTKKATKPVVAIPFESIKGKAYAGKIGQTVVDFFGTRNVYGDVTQEMYIWNDSIACVRQMNGSIEEYSFPNISYDNNTLKVGDFCYTVNDGGTYLQLQTTKQNNEKREGKLTNTIADNLLSTMLMQGKHLNGMTIQTDEDKRNAFICLSAAAQGNVPGAQDALAKYYKRLADNGREDAMIWMIKSLSNGKEYGAAHEYVDRLIEQQPENIDYQCEKGMLYLMEKKDKEAKKLWKKIQKKYPKVTELSSHPFVKSMKR